jgi:hypothetical protein
MIRAIITLAFILALSGCAGKDFVQGSWYKSACEGWFDGKWSSAGRGSCTRGPIDLIFDAVS